MGKEIAITFAREGADLVLVARKLGDKLNRWHKLLVHMAYELTF